MEVDEQIKTFRDFIEQNYYPQLLEAVRKGESYLKLDFSDLVKFNTEISEELLENPQSGPPWNLRLAHVVIERRAADQLHGEEMFALRRPTAFVHRRD